MARVLVGNFKGPKGDKGDTGPQGLQGATGAKGATGATGPKGDTGPQGLQGPKGDKGDPGATGATGAKGDPGATGPKGDKGDTGPKGDPAVIDDTGWVDITPESGFTGMLKYRVRAGFATVWGVLTGECSLGTIDVAVAKIPVNARPVPGAARGTAYFGGGHAGGAFVSTGGNVGVNQQTGAIRSNPQFTVIYPVG